MSEFKFACPVCGQHITADSSTSGGQLECPTCFQKIVVPQASAADSKFILSASQVGKPRPVPADTAGGSTLPKPSSSALPIAIVLVVLLGAAGAAAYFFRDKIFKSSSPSKPIAESKTNSPGKKAVDNTPMTIYPIPTNFFWTLNLTNIAIPDSPASGSIRSNGFVCERSTLQGGTLTLRQGKSWPPDLGITIQLFAKQGEELSGKTVDIPADRQPPVPRVTIRWKDAQHEPLTHVIENGGYALKVVFGDAANGRMPGKLYLSLPDDAKSFLAGSFDAEIRKPPAPKKKSPPKPLPAPKQ